VKDYESACRNDDFDALRKVFIEHRYFVEYIILFSNGDILDEPRIGLQLDLVQMALRNRAYSKCLESLYHKLYANWFNVLRNRMITSLYKRSFLKDEG